jgi:release factor glutamine methyltransferase
MGKFYHGKIELEVPETVYYPREDSLLMAKVIEDLKIEKENVLEIGCGSGFLSILLAMKGAGVTAVDINEEAVGATESNAKANGVDITCLRSDLFEKTDERFDMIVFNPPYLPVEEGENDAIYAGGLSGRETIERFIAGVKGHLNRNGTVLIVISSLTGEHEVKELFEKEGMNASVVAKEKIPWEELIVIQAKYPKELFFGH